MKKQNETINGVASTVSTKRTNDQQWTKYHNAKGGHGFAAEDANALHGKWQGKRVDKVGTDKSKNGDDRIVNGVEIQTKYYASPESSINAAFENGQYRYPGMKLEVPKNQYDKAVQIMRERISNGKVPGVTDPKMAEQIVNTN